MEERRTILADTHVHIYDCYSVEKFFENVVNNFTKAHNQLELTKKFIGVLFLTEAGETNYFKKIFDNIDYFSDFLKLKVEHTSEENSLRIKLDSENYIIIVEGQQIITRENLEVLALGTIHRFEYGKSILDTIEKIREYDAIPVIPWGVGKWFGKRGKIVRDILQCNSKIFLGDNSGRPVFWNKPKLFDEGKKRKIFTLRGTDPLPLKAQDKKAGAFGFFLVSEFDIERPWDFLKQHFKSINKEPDNYGKLESVSNFMKNQILVQINKLTK